MRTLVAAVGACALAAAGTAAHATSILYAVSGDGGSPSETLFELSKTDGSSTFVQTLGNGDDGEAIGFNPVDGHLYHASGHTGSSVIFEQVLDDFSGTLDIPIGAPLTDEEAQALTWDASRGEFLWKQDHGTGPLYSVTTGGVATLVGGMDHQSKGLAFVGSTLYSVAVNDDLLRIIDASDASTVSSIGITLAGFTVTGATGLATDPDDGTLWALLKTGGNPGFRHLATIDTTTGEATLIGTTDVTGLAGIAFVTAASVPEPASAALLALGLLGAAGFRRRSGRRPG